MSGRAGFLCVAVVTCALAAVTACRRGARPGSGSSPSSSSPAERPRPDGSPHLAWTSSWDGGFPTLLASAGGELAIAVFGTATLGDVKVGTVGPASLSLIRLGPDGKPGAVTRIAPALAWAHPLALLDDGGLVIDGLNPASKTADLMCARADGSIAWAQPLPVSDHVIGVAAAVAGDTIGIVLHAGSRGVDGKGNVTTLKWGGQQPSEEVRAYDAAGKLRFTSRIKGSRSVFAIRLVARPSGGLIAGGHFWPDLHIEGSGGPSIAIATGANSTAGWIAAWDVVGRVSWLRKLAMSGNDTSVQDIHELADGTVRVIGLGRGRLLDVGHATVVDTDVIDAGAADARARDAGPLDPGRQTTFVVRLDGASGAPLSVLYLPHSRTTYAWSGGLIDVAASKRNESEETYTTELAAWDGAGQAWWRTELDANVSAVAVAPEAVLVFGKYNLLMTLPGREPPAFVIGSGSERPFIGLLAWKPGAIAVAPAPAAVPFTDLHDRAMRALRAKRFKEACELFVAAQRARPADAANMADLALCLQRAGDREAAVRANRYAIRLASVPGATDEKGQRLRKAAYYNLGRLEAGAAEDGEFGCKRPVYSSSTSGTTGGAHHISDFTVARFSLDEAAADLGEDYKLDYPQLGSEEGATQDNADEAVYDVTLELSEEDRDLEGEPSGSSQAGCKLVHADGCSGHLGFVCSFADDGDRKAHGRAIELTLKPTPPSK